MSVETLHPLYQALLEDWAVMSVTYSGERAVKSAEFTYLPASAGMSLDGLLSGQPGYVSYTSYISRAKFPEVVKPTVETLIGLMHRKPPKIELPPAMEPMRENATQEGESLELLLRKINENQLRNGRLGLLVDVPSGDATVLPFITVYPATAVRNWDDRVDSFSKRRLQFVVLDQSGYRRQNTADFSWTLVNEYLAVVLRDGTVEYQLHSANGGEVVTNSPSLGGNRFSEIPFVFINTIDLTAQPDQPPLMPLAQQALAIYRLEADYRQALYMQGQDTLLLTGVDPDKEYRVGAGSVIALEAPEGDGKFIGVDSQGLSEMRQALENDYARMEEIASNLLRTRGGEAESGEALRTRVAARTASIVGLVRAGAAGLQQSLRYCAEIKGLDPEKVVVEPNLDFTEDMFDGDELLKFGQAKALGAPISWRSVHKILQQREVTDLSYDDELDEIAKEDAALNLPRNQPPE